MKTRVVLSAWILASASAVAGAAPVNEICYSQAFAFGAVPTPTNAMAYATRYVKQRDMIRTGVVLDILGAILLGLWFGWVL